MSTPDCAPPAPAFAAYTLHAKITAIIAAAPDPATAARNAMDTLALELSRLIEALQREQETLMQQRAAGGFADLTRDHAHASRVHKRDRDLIRIALGFDATGPEPPSAPDPVRQPPAAAPAVAPQDADPARPFSWWRRNRRTDTP